MKVNYEFDLPDERNEHKLFNIADNMYSALHNISNILRKYRKGWEKEDFDKLMDEINEELIESRMDDIE